MRRFFRAHRGEDYSQIQYLTSKCNRLAHDKAMLERECVLARAREKCLQDDVQAAATHIHRQGQLNAELRIKHNQLVSRLHHQQDLVLLLQNRVSLAEQESFRDAALLGLELEQVNSELLGLQSSEVYLEDLVEEMHVEAQHRAARMESLQAELHSRTAELEDLQSHHAEQALELEELRSAHQRKVGELQRECEGSQRTLQETAQQFEWLCEQQHYWISCVKRFKDGLADEREGLLQQVDTLEKKVVQLKVELKSPSQTLLCPLQNGDSQCCDTTTAWNQDMMAELQSQVEDGRGLYKDLFSQGEPTMDHYQKPP